MLVAFMRLGFVDVGPCGWAARELASSQGVSLAVAERIQSEGLVYVVDFGLTCRLGRGLSAPTVQVAIECDGHAFHERTKEQAARDKSRDRALSRAGWIVLRFTGAELHADSDRCAEEAIGILNGWAKRVAASKSAPPVPAAAPVQRPFPPRRPAPGRDGPSHAELAAGATMLLEALEDGVPAPTKRPEFKR